MIFLKSQNLLFLKPRKVAGTSFEIALSAFATAQDVITPIGEEDETTRRKLGFRGPQNYRYRLSELKSPRQLAKALYRREMPWKFFNHIPAAEARRQLGADIFDAAFKLTIVRNPYDMLISLYYWGNRKRPEPPSFSDWVRRNQGSINVNNDQYMIDGRPVIDFFIRYETLRQDIEALEKLRPELTGLAASFASLTAKSNVRPKNSTPVDLFSQEADLAATVRFLNDFVVNEFRYTMR